MPLLSATVLGLAMVWLPLRLNSSTSRTPVQESQLAQLMPGRKLSPMQLSLVSRNANVSPAASPLAFSLAAPPEFVSIPWPHSWRNTAASSPVFEQPPPDR